MYGKITAIGIIATSLFSGITSAVTEDTADAFQVHLKAPIDLWDEAVPLGNGVIGGLLWGKDNEIRLSLDRGDLWDNRLYKAYANKEFNYDVLKTFVQAGEYEQLKDQYKKGSAWPSKLPGARLVLTLPKDAESKMFTLDMKKGLGRVELKNNSEIECFFSATQPVALMKIPCADVGFKLIANKAVEKLGYTPAKINSSSDRTWLIQNANTGFQYVIYMQSTKVPDGTLIAVTTTTNKNDIDPLVAAKKLTEIALRTGYDKMFREHEKWWNNFWAQSTVTVPEFRIQQGYNLAQYFYGAASRSDMPPIPLQGLWTADDGKLPPWRGDYHNDINLEQTYWAYPTSGRFSQGMSYLNFMWNLVPTHQKWAREFWHVPRGFIIPGVMALDGRPIGTWFQYSLSPTLGAWTAQAFYTHWRYTMDRQFLETRAYPYCTGIAEAIVSLLRPDQNGKLKLPLSTSPEIHENKPQAWLTPNSNFDLALIRALFAVNVEMAKDLGKTDESAHWKKLLNEMDDLAVEGNNGALRVSPDEPLKFSHRHLSHLVAIYPLGTLNIEGSERDREIITHSMEQIEHFGTQRWIGFSWSWMACMRARTGEPEQALNYLRDFFASFTLRNGFHCNGEQTDRGLSSARYRPVTLEGNMAGGQAVHEMLLQSWSNRIRVFPAVSKEWKDISFKSLRAEGGFIVDAIRKNSVTEHITIKATTAGKLQLSYPFGKDSYNASMPVTFVNGNLVCQMKKGEIIKFDRKNITK